MRTRSLVAILAIATTAALSGCTTIVPVEGVPHAAIVATDRDAAGVLEACWLEPKPNDAPEQILCGSVNLAPADAYGFRSLAEQRAAHAVAADGSARTAPAATIYEDDPQWNCHTMGNRTCDISGYWDYRQRGDGVLDCDDNPCKVGLAGVEYDYSRF